tara:strand:- start:563 stop:862 length:300 start_codon:yes stop_codon:yes gene_type:complete
MLYTLVSVILYFSKPDITPKISNTYTFKTLALCEKALDDKFIFINKKKNYKILSEFINYKKSNKRILKIIFIDEKITNYSKCVRSEIAFNKEMFKNNIN